MVVAVDFLVFSVGFDRVRCASSRSFLERWCGSSANQTWAAASRLDLLTTNLGVRSSNLFGRASNVLIVIQIFCAFFRLLTEFVSG